MNYLTTVLTGILEHEYKYLDRYFIREFENSKLQADEFYEGCEAIVNIWHGILDAKVNQRIAELKYMLYNTQNAETKEYCKQELSNIRPDGVGSETYTVHLFEMTDGKILPNSLNEVFKYGLLRFNKDEGKTKIYLTADDISRLKTAINRAYIQTTLAAKGNTEPQPKSVFYENVPKELIEKIKDEFKSAKGKELAVLIYVLDTDGKINFVPNSKTFGLAPIIQEITGRQKGDSTQGEKSYFGRNSNKIKAQHLKSQSTKILIDKIRKKIVDFH